MQRRHCKSRREECKPQTASRRIPAIHHQLACTVGAVAGKPFECAPPGVGVVERRLGGSNLRVAVLGLSLLAPMLLSGCLADDIWREPFVWREQLSVGENPDGAQAFAGAVAALADQAGEEGDVLVDSVEDLPNNVVFQNLRQFLDRQSPGSGQQFQEGVRVVTSNVSNAYATLTGQVADGYAQVTGPFAGEAKRFALAAPDRTTRIHFVVDVVLTQQPPEGGTNPTPAGVVEVRILDPQGRERAFYSLDRTRHIEDQFVTGTFGDANKVIVDLAGPWTVEVYASGEGAWSVTADTYEPEYDDYKWWQFWRGEKREVVGS